MTILALEFSSPQRSVAVARGREVLAEAVESGGGTRAFGLIEKVLTDAAVERRQIEVVAVGLGPGSYTGIRAAIAIAQGWQLARGVRLLGVSSADALAAQAQAEQIFGRVNVIVDAQRGEVYRAAYDVCSDGWRLREPLSIVAPAEMQPPGGATERFVGPEVTKWFAGGKILFPRASALVKLAACRSDFRPGETLEPIYLRETNFVRSPPAARPSRP
jgi:tRNA threonylcarbamoyl adenosine modification protein YeaZ